MTWRINNIATGEVADFAAPNHDFDRTYLAIEILEETFNLYPSGEYALTELVNDECSIFEDSEGNEYAVTCEYSCARYTITDI